MEPNVRCIDIHRCTALGWGLSWVAGWLHGLRADRGWATERQTERESEQATQVAVSKKPVCVCCWPLHISTTLPQFVFCVLRPQMNFLPPSFFFSSTHYLSRSYHPRPKHTHTVIHTYWHHPITNLKVWIHTRTNSLFTSFRDAPVAYVAPPTKRVCEDTDPTFGITGLTRTQDQICLSVTGEA